jgi:membrane glycosyltransferase
MSDNLATFPDLNTSLTTDMHVVVVRRRVLFAALVGASSILFALWFYYAVAAGGFGLLEACLLALFFAQITWLSLDFWNAITGFYILYTSDNVLARVSPPLASVPDKLPFPERVAVVMTIRNEDANGVFARLDAMKTALDKTPFAAQFDYFVLSDSSVPRTIEAEEAACTAFRAKHGEASRLVYRRRTANEGYKAGNVRDFCETWGKQYEFMLLLDADSLLTGETILRLVRTMHANPRIGVLQTTMVGVLMPSFFAQVFEFGHRLSMLCSSMGSVWWQGDRCQFWGHNAIIRLAPFIEFCFLPPLPGRGPFSGHVICHDQIEASLMQRAGYEVRVLPEESGSYEGVPPTLIEFMGRHYRWFHGNLKNLRLIKPLKLPGMSRFHLIEVAHVYLGWVAAVVFVLLAAAKAATWQNQAEFPVHAALALYLAVFAVFLTSRLASTVQTLLSGVSRYGGTRAVIVGQLIEVCFSLIVLPISMLSATWFFVWLLLGRGMKWEAPRRDSYALSWRGALARFWGHAVFAVAMIVFLVWAAPGALPWFIPFLFGPLVTIPFAVLASSPSVTDRTRRMKLCAIPEDFDEPIEVVMTRAADAQSWSVARVSPRSWRCYRYALNVANYLYLAKLKLGKENRGRAGSTLTPK